MAGPYISFVALKGMSARGILEGAEEPRKGGFSEKGVSAGSSAMPKETKNTERHGAQQYIGHSERHSQKTRTFCKDPPF